jgi:hypothetical protein
MDVNVFVVTESDGYSRKVIVRRRFKDSVYFKPVEDHIVGFGVCTRTSSPVDRRQMEICSIKFMSIQGNLRKGIRSGVEPERRTLAVLQFFTSAAKSSVSDRRPFTSLQLNRYRK